MQELITSSNRIATALEAIAASLQDIAKHNLINALPLNLENRKGNLSEEDWFTSVKEVLRQREKVAQLVGILPVSVEHPVANPEQAQHP